jgi:hypothetical protein
MLPLSDNLSTRADKLTGLWLLGKHGSFECCLTRAAKPSNSRFRDILYQLVKANPSKHLGSGLFISASSEDGRQRGTAPGDKGAAVHKTQQLATSAGSPQMPQQASYLDQGTSCNTFPPGLALSSIEGAAQALTPSFWSGNRPLSDPLPFDPGAEIRDFLSESQPTSLSGLGFLSTGFGQPIAEGPGLSAQDAATLPWASFEWARLFSLETNSDHPFYSWDVWSSYINDTSENNEESL